MDPAAGALSDATEEARPSRRDRPGRKEWGTATGLLRTEWGTTMTEVDQNEAVFTFDSEEEELVTYGVGPCIAIAIVNQTRRWAGLCHYDNAHHKVPQLRAFLSDARRACGPDDTVELWIGGGDNTDQTTADGVNR